VAGGKIVSMLDPNTKHQLKRFWMIFSIAVFIVLAALIVYQIPWVHQRASWRLQAAYNYVRLIFSPVGSAPTPDEKFFPPLGTDTPSPTVAKLITSATPSTPQPTPTVTPSPTAIPTLVTLQAPAFDRSKDIQDWNNCGPATLVLAMRYYGWKGDQYTVDAVVKTIRGDKNVNIDEMQYYVLTQAGWLGAEFRVGGSIQQLKQFIAAGYPVMIEEAFAVPGEDYWPNDDHWTGHYLLLTGFDDKDGIFITQDVYRGPNTVKSYKDLDKDWKAYNRVFMILYPTQQTDDLKALLGTDWDKDVNRQHALDTARAETVTNPEDAFAWFNLGSNLVYFDKYAEAASAYDKAIKIGLPQRMLRYQFGPFLAYFKIDRNKDLLALTKYALNITPNSEEILVWRAWALYRDGDKDGALKALNEALIAHPGYSDAQYALAYINSNP
jgi:tetratricopeptide (TPR) repeat protein